MFGAGVEQRSVNGALAPCTVEPHLSVPQLSGCSDYPTIELMIFIGFLLCIK